MSDQPKELIFEEEARDKLAKGISQLTDVVKVTLGPKGRHVGLDLSWGSPKITSDGSSIASDVELKNQYENMGASMGKQVAKKMKEKCGDGTTTSLVLLGSMVASGVKNIAAGASPILVKRGMEKTIQAIVSQLEKEADQIQNENEITKIATAAASADMETGKMISDAFQAVGREGVISIEEAKGLETSIEMVEGMKFDQGYASAYFCTNPENMTCVLNRPRILITDQKISSIQDLLPFLQDSAATAQELLIIAEDFEGDVLSTLVVNRLRGTLKICAVKAPGFGDRRKALLQDIATITGAQLITEDLGLTLKDVKLEMAGTTEKVVVTKDHTTVVGGNGDAKAIAKRVKQIEAEIAQSGSEYDREKLQERKAKLSGGVAVIRVGATTESELKRKKQVFEDSLNSTRAAIEDGIIVGGGVALLNASKQIGKALQLAGDEKIGMEIILDACQAPFKQLIENSGFDSAVLLQEVLSGKGSLGFNTLTEKVEDLTKAGICDPVKVIKNALLFSSSAAGVILLSECLIGEAEEEA